MKKIIFIFFLFILSCSPWEVARLAGIGVEPFKTEGKVYTKIIHKDPATAYEQVLTIMGDLGANFYRGSPRKKFLIMTNFKPVFRQCSESTEVAVFFTEVKEKETKVEVSSLNHSLSEFVALELFKGLEGQEYRKVTARELKNAKEKKEE